MYETLMLQQDARGVATVTLHRPEKHNAMNAQMIRELSDVAQILGQSAAVRVVVLTGAGQSFCAGADLTWMQSQIAAKPDARAVEARALAIMLLEWNLLPKPIVAAVQGNAFGGGIGLISIADVAIAVASAKFALSETRLGLVPATIGPYVIARIGESAARRVILSGRIFEAPEALSFDLLSRVVPDDSLSFVVEEEVSHFLKSAPQATAQAKKMIREMGAKIDEALITQTIQALMDCWARDEAAAGISAFFAKKAPPWKL